MAEESTRKQETRTFTFVIFRFDPDRQEGSSQKEYRIDLPKGTTVLDALVRIKEEQDNTLSFRYSCRMGVCGSCGMFINGLPMLSCQTQVYELESDQIEIKPLPNYDVLRDLASDLTPLFRKHGAVLPWIIRKDAGELENPTAEFLQTPENLEWIYQFTYCLKCGLCLSACPTAASDTEFLGPQALAQAYRYSMDMRDEGFIERMSAVDDSHGCWRCHYASSCSQVCPKGVDPALGIQLLKREIILRKLRLRRARKGSGLLIGPIEGAKRKEGVPDAPPRSV
jgi:succinate dehydrogenase / fumarate reductase iron-sulfur subunit